MNKMKNTILKTDALMNSRNKFNEIKTNWVYEAGKNDKQRAKRCGISIYLR